MNNNRQFNMHGYNDLVTTVFNKIYPIIAKQIIDYTGIREGVCLDIGSGTGDLGIEIAKLTNMKVYLVDINEDSKTIAKNKIEEEKLKDRVFPIISDVHNLLFENEIADLIVSRSSYNFWENKNKAFHEIYRVLKKNGKLYIGKGYGNYNCKREIEDIMFKINPEKWYPNKKEKTPEEFKKEFSRFIEKNQVENYKFINDERGNWFIMEK